jgi:hypothetical protein
MQEPDLLKLFVVSLEQANFNYVITGSIASSLYAEPRLTHDIDIVIHLNLRDAKQIPVIFPPKNYYCPPMEIISDEIKRPVRAQFNVIHHDSGFKADFFLIGNDPLHEWAFSNKRRMPIGDEYSVWLAPPEYVIIRKMQYFSEGDSDKHLRDIQNMLAILHENLNFKFIEMQSTRLGLTQIWQRILEKIESD